MTKRYLVLDIETTGLKAGYDQILEISWVVCDTTIQPIRPQHTFLVDHGAEWNKVWSLLNDDPFVKDMHKKSGLWDAMHARPAYSLFEIGQALISELSEIKQDGDTIHLLGKNVGFDRQFLQHFPEFDGIWDTFVHHRLYDLDTNKLQFEDAGIPFPEYVNFHPHRATEDVEEAIGIARQIQDLNNELAANL